MREAWSLIDAARTPLGTTVLRGDELPEGAYHIVVAVWVACPGKGLLLTLRHSKKEVYPNTWENTGGSALAGETSAQAIKRELFEETGIRAREDEFTLIASEFRESAIVDTYLLIRDVDAQNVVLQAGETLAAQVATLGRVRQMAANGALAKPIAQQFYKVEEILENAIAQ